MTNPGLPPHRLPVCPRKGTIFSVSSPRVRCRACASRSGLVLQVRSMAPQYCIAAAPRRAGRGRGTDLSKPSSIFPHATHNGSRAGGIPVPGFVQRTLARRRLQSQGGTCRPGGLSGVLGSGSPAGRVDCPEGRRVIVGDAAGCASARGGGRSLLIRFTPCTFQAAAVPHPVDGVGGYTVGLASGRYARAPYNMLAGRRAPEQLAPA